MTIAGHVATLNEKDWSGPEAGRARDRARNTLLKAVAKAALERGWTWTAKASSRGHAVRMTYEATCGEHRVRTTSVKSEDRTVYDAAVALCAFEAAQLGVENPGHELHLSEGMWSSDVQDATHELRTVLEGRLKAAGREAAGLERAREAARKNEARTGGRVKKNQMEKLKALLKELNLSEEELLTAWKEALVDQVHSL